MTKFGQAEYCDFMARVFADKLDEILDADDKQNFNSKIRKIYTVSSRLQGTQREEVLIC